MNSRLARLGAARQGNIKAEGKALASQLLDEWRREKRRENEQLLVQLQRFHTLANFGKRLNAPANEIMHIEPSELA